jgi:hypothetical protein
MNRGACWTRNLFNRFNGLFADARQTGKTVAGLRVARFHRD